MKTKFYLPIICLLALSTSVFISCDKDEDSDTTKPIILLHEPEEGQAIQIGNVKGMHFDMDLSDDVMLKSYKIEIHNNFDNHPHSRGNAAAEDGSNAAVKDGSNAAANAEETVDFIFNRSYDVSGQKNAHIHHHDIKIPANATPGAYHLMVYCTDAAGNESHIARNIMLSNDVEDEDHHHGE